MENKTLKLLEPPPNERLAAWLKEIYGKSVEIYKRDLLRHRDLSYVERLWLKDAIPETIIYKVVLPPWDIEQDLHERILIPSISYSARLYLAGHYSGSTVLFFEDLGQKSLLNCVVNNELAIQVGTGLAKLHRSFTYRIAELEESLILRRFLPNEYEVCATQISDKLLEWSLINTETQATILQLARGIANVLTNEPVTLVHGDLYAENILINNNQLFFIDWSWFTMISTPLLDLDSLTISHVKNGSFTNYKETVIDAYCLEYSRSLNEVLERLPFAEVLNRLLFLHWLVERRSRGIMGTTVGPVDTIIQTVVEELCSRFKILQE